MTWTQACCESCWFEREGEYEEMTEEERIEMNAPEGAKLLVSIRQPVTSRDLGLEQCSFCGNPTVVGIYVREDPTKVPFPREEDGD